MIHPYFLQTGKVTSVRHLDPNVACLQGAVMELKQYKVIGVVDRVMLAIDQLTEATCVIKVSH